MRTTTCDDCGQRIDVATADGPLPARCEACSKTHANSLSAARAKAARARQRAQREVACVDCGVALEWSGVNRPKLRCGPCRVVHNREQNRQRSLAWLRANPERAKEIQRKGYERNADVIRARALADHYRRRYGITIEDRDRLLDLQGGRCAICGGGPNGKGRLHVDHCHATNEIRGLLCHNCNTLLGLAADDPGRLRRAAEYIELHRKT